LVAPTSTTTCEYRHCGGIDFYDLRMPPLWRHQILRRLANAATMAAPTSMTTCECHQCGGIDFYDDLRMPPMW
ncbi:hypothetical protein AVEN_5890-1, partial [Araneus ventricosus]